jgi:hypothetical protein
VSLVAIVRLLSLHMTTALVRAGYTAPFALGSTPTLTVTGVTNASPMVVTVDGDIAIRPGLPLHVVISGVLGCTAANNLGADTVTPQAWHAVAISSSTFALYTIDVASGTVTASTGNGAYTTGGTVSKAFTDGAVLLGSRQIAPHSFPPRVVMIPRSFSFGPRDPASASNAAALVEQQRQRRQRSLATDKTLLEVHCWGVTTLPSGYSDEQITAWEGSRDPDYDFDACRELVHQVVRSAHFCCTGVYSAESGQWADQVDSETQVLRVGHVAVFGLVIDTPVLGELYARAPADVSQVSITALHPADAVTPEQVETGCEQG